MRLLLDEGFPSPPGFRPESVDANVEVVTPRQIVEEELDARAERDRFDALLP